MGLGLVGRDSAPAAHASPDNLTDADLLGQFAAGRDPAAFAALVRRHGPAVLGVCRRVLRDRHDAEEAFQMTFLALARRAAELRDPTRVGSWLYGVAVRTAQKVRSLAARRAARETPNADLDPPGRPAPDPDWPAVLAALDEEMVALPEKYRAPLVLCYLEGLTNEDAARRLGWPPGSMSYRLARGRELLRRRLTGRGVCLGLIPVFFQGLSEHAGAAEVPLPLLDSTVSRAVEEPDGAPPPWEKRAVVLALLIVLLLGGLGTAALAAFGLGDTCPAGCH